MKETTVNDVLEMGKWLGRREAFSLVAGRCSAADAQCLRELRESKRYKQLGLNWEECCKQKLGTSRSLADQIIRNLEEFGPDYFVMAQVTGISPKEYRRICGSVSNHNLLCAGDEIPISLEHAPRLAAAIEKLRQEAASAPEPEINTAMQVKRTLACAERTMRSTLAELEKLLQLNLGIGDRMRVQSLAGAAASRLTMLGQQFRP